MRKCFNFVNTNTESAAADSGLAQCFRAGAAVICELTCGHGALKLALLCLFLTNLGVKNGSAPDLPP